MQARLAILQAHEAVRIHLFRGPHEQHGSSRADMLLCSRRVRLGAGVSDSCEDWDNPRSSDELLASSPFVRRRGKSIWLSKSGGGLSARSRCSRSLLDDSSAGTGRGISKSASFAFAKCDDRPIGTAAEPIQPDENLGRK